MNGCNKKGNIMPYSNSYKGSKKKRNKTHISSEFWGDRDW